MTALTLVITGLIHLMPLSGALGAEQLARLYGLAVNEPNLEVLMRHRAVMFGLLGLFMIAAAFMPSLQVAALIAGFASVISFLWLAFSIGGYNTQLAKVVIADLVALVCLLVGGVALAISPPAR